MLIEINTTIHRPIEDVFTYLTDTDYQPQFDSSLISVSRKPTGPIQSGTQIIEVRQLMGRQITTHYEVIDYVPHSRYVGKSINGDMKGTGTRLFVPVPGGTRVTYRLNFEQKGFLAFLSPIFSRVLTKALKQDLDKAKRLLKSQFVLEGVQEGV